MKIFLGMNLGLLLSLLLMLSSHLLLPENLHKQHPRKTG
jgi:hypothetical protein